MAKKQTAPAASVFAKPAPVSTDAGQASVAAASDASVSVDGGEGEGFDIDGDDEIQTEKSSGEAVAPVALVVTSVPVAKPAKPSTKAKPAPVPALEDDEKPLTADEREASNNAANARRLKESQDAAVSESEHIAKLSRLGRENVRRVQLEKIAAKSPFVRELIAENAALKAELAALKKASSPAG